MKQKRTWIVVADGGKARILIMTGKSSGVQQLPHSEFHHSNAPSHDLVTDRQPRVQESVGSARHAVEPRIDPHVQEEQQFLKRLTAYLEHAAQSKEFEHLVVVAPATALGVLRKDFSPLLNKLLFREFEHDYTHQDNDYVYQHIKEGLPV